MKVNIKYQIHTSYLTESEWCCLISNYLDLIKSSNIGKILLNSIDNYIEKGYKINILNYSKNKSIQYPHCFKDSDTEISVIIPDTPYFIKVQTFNENLVDNIQISEDVFNLLNGIPITKKLDNSFVNCFSTFDFQPNVVTLFHELVHCLRMLKNINSNFEEESTIYGLVNDALKIDGKFIIENNFRKELNMKMRISHNSEDYYIYGVNNNKEFSKEYLKNLYTQLMI